MQVLVATADRPHVPIKNLRPSVSDTTVELLEICLAKDPLKRYCDGSSLLEALKVARQSLADVRSPKSAIQQLTMLRSVPERGLAVPVTSSPLRSPPSTVTGPIAELNVSVGKVPPKRRSIFKLAATLILMAAVVCSLTYLSFARRWKFEEDRQAVLSASQSSIGGHSWESGPTLAAKMVTKITDY